MNAKKIAANRSLNGRTSCCALSAAGPDSAMPASSAPTAAENFATSATPAIGNAKPRIVSSSASSERMNRIRLSPTSTRIPRNSSSATAAMATPAATRTRRGRHRSAMPPAPAGRPPSRGPRSRGDHHDEPPGTAGVGPRARAASRPRRTTRRTRCHPGRPRRADPTEEEPGQHAGCGVQHDVHHARRDRGARRRQQVRAECSSPRTNRTRIEAVSAPSSTKPWVSTSGTMPPSPNARPARR